MFALEPTDPFLRQYVKMIRRDPLLGARVQKALSRLKEDPRQQSLKSHKVDTSRYGERWSSRVTGDVRIIWDYDARGRLVLILFDIGGHSGGKKVYK